MLPNAALAYPITMDSFAHMDGPPSRGHTRTARISAFDVRYDSISAVKADITKGPSRATSGNVLAPLSLPSAWMACGSRLHRLYLAKHQTLNGDRRRRDLLRCAGSQADGTMLSPENRLWHETAFLLLGLVGLAAVT